MKKIKTLKLEDNPESTWDDREWNDFRFILNEFLHRGITSERLSEFVERDPEVDKSATYNSIKDYGKASRIIASSSFRLRIFEVFSEGDWTGFSKDYNYILPYGMRQYSMYAIFCGSTLESQNLDLLDDLLFKSEIKYKRAVRAVELHKKNLVRNAGMLTVGVFDDEYHNYCEGLLEALFTLEVQKEISYELSLKIYWFLKSKIIKKMTATAIVQLIICIKNEQVDRMAFINFLSELEDSQVDCCISSIPEDFSFTAEEIKDIPARWIIETVFETA